MNKLSKELVLHEISGLRWGEAFSNCSCPALTQKVDPARQTLLVYQQEQWKIALHWFVRLKFDPKHKIPGKKIHRELMQPKGRLLVSLYELCIQSHPQLKRFLGHVPPYIDGEIWFLAVCSDIQLQTISAVVNHWGVDDSPKGRSRKNANAKCSPKEAAHESERQVVRMLASEQNPWKDGDSQALELLMDVAIALNKKSPAFEKQYWEPFRKAYSVWLRDRERNPNWGVAQKKGGDVLVSLGQGRGRRRVAPQFLFSRTPA